MATMYENLADVNPLAARSQRLFHGFSGPDDRHAAHRPLKLHTLVWSLCRGDDRVWLKGKQPERGLDHLQSKAT